MENIEIWKHMIKENVPVEHIIDQIEKHIIALKLLPGNTENLAEELEKCSEYLKTLKETEN